MTSKDDPLAGYLAARDAEEAPLTVAEVGAVLGFPLPADRPDLAAGTVTFRRVTAP